MSIAERSRKASALYSPKNCFKAAVKLRSVRDVFRYPAKSLSALKAEFGHSWIMDYLRMWLLDLNDSVQVNHKLSEGAMDFIAERIFETYSLKVTDLALFFRNVKEGVYGQFYENLSPDKIMTWIATYWEDRCEVGAMEAQQNHDNFSAIKDKVHPNVIKAMFDGVGEDEVTHDPGKGFGSRQREKYGLKEGERSPVQDRDVYLEILKETAAGTETKYLLKSIEHLKAKGNEPDALAILENELKKRK